MNTLGEMALSFAVLASAVAILASMVAARFQSTRALNAARWSIAALAVMLCVSSVALFVALLGGRFFSGLCGKIHRPGIANGI